MEARHFDAIVRELASRFSADSPRLKKISEGENHIYEFEVRGVAHILRVTEERRRKREDILSETEFVQYLNSRNGPAIRLVPARDGARVHSAGEGDTALHAYCYIKAEGAFPGEMTWGPELFRLWGRTAGQLHSLSREFRPVEKSREQWFENEFVVACMESRGKEAVAGERCRAIVDRLRSCPVSRDNYGIIHSDLHPGNMSLDRGRIRLFDFDDCSYGFFLQEAAVALFFSHWHPRMIEGALAQDRAKTTHAKLFMECFLSGYREVFAVDPAQLPFFQDMLKLQRCLLWACLREDGEDLGPWAPVYEKWFKEIAEDLPFVDLDFSNY